MLSAAPQRKESGAEYTTEGDPKQMEPLVVKKANREILDHERKRRVELKCMELQEMMEEQGWVHYMYWRRVKVSKKWIPLNIALGMYSNNLREGISLAVFLICDIISVREMKNKTTNAGNRKQK